MDVGDLGRLLVAGNDLDRYAGRGRGRAQFAPVLRERLLDLVALLQLRMTVPYPGYDEHAALVDAVVRGDAAEAGRVLRVQLSRTLRLLQSL